MNSINYTEIFGIESPSVVDVNGIRLHSSVHTDYRQLCVDAKDAGFDLAVASSWRSFSRQLQIWNEKASGLRPTLNDFGQPIDLTTLPPREQVFAILRWSALPGASRHHWGSDLDVYDLSRMPAGYRLRLDQSETEYGGVFSDFHRWLDEYLPFSAFFRPYVEDAGGIAVEPWHLSHAEVAAAYQSQLNKQVLRDGLARVDMLLLGEVLDAFDEIYERFVWVDWGRYPTKHRPPTDSVAANGSLP